MFPYILINIIILKEAYTTYEEALGILHPGQTNAAGLARVEDVDRLLLGAAVMMATADKPVIMATAAAGKPMMMAHTWWAGAV